MNGYMGYQPPEAVLEDMSTTPHELAERGTRFGANLLDGLVLIPAAIPGAIAWFMFMDNPSNLVALILLGLLTFACVAAYLGLNLYWLHQNGQTIGKRITGIKVVRSDGDRVTLLRFIFLRWFPLALAGAIPFVGRLIGLVDALLIFRESRQCLHDQIADTIVIRA